VAAEIGINTHTPGSFGLYFFYKQAAITCCYQESISVCPANYAWSGNGTTQAKTFICHFGREQTEPFA
jgi:hypothetical protein